jgi:hypothetical protein
MTDRRRTRTVPTRRPPWRRRLAAALPLLAFASVLWLKPMGLLLWARIRILTNIPRTAIAEPRPPESFSDLAPPTAGDSGWEGCAVRALPDRADPPIDCKVGAKSPLADAELPGTP